MPSQGNRRAIEQNWRRGVSVVTVPAGNVLVRFVRNIWSSSESVQLSASI